MYRHERVMQIMGQAQDVVRGLFAYYVAHPNELPPEWGQGIDAEDEAGRARRVADFIAGMTDGYALINHARHFDSTPELR
jgi:dGTPase